MATPDKTPSHGYEIIISIKLKPDAEIAPLKAIREMFTKDPKVRLQLTTAIERALSQGVLPLVERGQSFQGAPFDILAVRVEPR
jgi:hypothetical protein